MPGAPEDRSREAVSRVIPVAEGTRTPSAPAPPAHATRSAVAWIDGALALFWNHPALFGALAALALLSAVWGFVSFYGPQYGLVPWYLLPFVPDSPLAVSAWLVAALAIKAGWDKQSGAGGTAWAFFGNWAIVWNAKVGVWTVFVLLFYHDVFFAGSRAHQLFQGVLIVAHAGMLAYALLLFRKVRALPAIGYVAVLAVVFLWDFADYFFVPILMPESAIQVFPLGVPPDLERLRVTALLSLLLSAGFTLALTIGIRLRGGPSPR